MNESLTSELWLKIDQSHLKYLQSEDTPLKLEIRKKLEGLVGDYLSIVPQQRKFVSSATGEIILNSAKLKPDFSLIKAANAFRAIEQYAANIINQPWRQEFWSIRQYSGFYKHSVETALFGAEKMFLDMGYSANSGQAQVLCLAQPRVGQHPVNIDMVTSVARDCVLACVECHLLAEIHNNVSAQFPTLLEEVIEFRREHIGSVEVCVRELLYRKNQLRYQQFPMTSPQYGLQNFGPGPVTGFPPGHPTGPCPPPPVSVPSYPGLNGHQTNGYTPVTFHGSGPVYGYPEYQSHPPPMAPVPVNGHPYAPVNGFHGPPAAPAPFLPPGVPGQGHQGHHHSHSHHSPAGSSSTCTLRQIPTTILELAGQNQEPVAPERRSRSDRDNGARPREHKESRNGKSKSRKSGVEEDFDNWDYVYKHLEQTGYTKDQAERPDVLESPEKSDEELRRNIQGLRLREDEKNGDGHGRNGDNYHNGHHGRHGGGRHRSDNGGHHQGGRNRSEHGHRYKEENHYRSRDETNYRNSRVETSESEQEQDHSSRYSSAVSEDTLQPPHRQARGGGHHHQQQQHHQQHHSQPQTGRAELWECSTCTFLNKQSRNICEMCSKSRDFQPQPEIRSVEPAHAPLSRKLSIPKIDGVACTKCTLVNSLSSKTCDACGATLPKNFWESFRAIQKQNDVFSSDGATDVETMSKNSTEEFPALQAVKSRY